MYKICSVQDIGAGQCVQNSGAERSKGQIYICETQLCQHGIFGMNVDTKQPAGVYSRVCLNNYKWEYIKLRMTKKNILYFLKASRYFIT